MFKAESYAGYKLCWPGDLVINSLWAWGGGLGVTQHHGIISTAYSVYRPRPSAQMNPRFLHELVRSSAFHWELQVRSKGVWISRLQLTDTSFLDAPIPLPPPDEQAAIVRFLDHANRKIDGFIRAKRKLIGLLNEQKQAIIHRAVTRGLHPDVPLKPSGIPWLGDIPMHWEVPRVKQCARKISKGTTPSTEGRAILESGPVRFLKAENISAGCITNKPLCFIDEETNRVIRRSQLAENDILFVIAGATLGKTAVVSGEILPANTNQAVAFIRPNSRVVPRFLELWLQSPRIKELIWLNAVQSAQPNLSMADLGNFVTPVPPRNEQQQILDFVKEATKPMSAVIARTEREIALMQEYRTRLTAELVTGKLDVRAAAAQLPAPPAETSQDSQKVPKYDKIEPESDETSDW
jgi:type I restriction enzyme S subunit